MTHPHITVVGNLTADPELKYVGSGTAVASFTVASTPRTYNKTTDSWEDGEPMFVRCSVWRDYAENVTESLTKGMRVIVQGRLSVRTYQRNDGSQGTSVEMQVDEVGPSLRYATAQVTRTGTKNSQTGGQAWTTPQTSQDRAQASQNQNQGLDYQTNNYGAPRSAQQPQQGDPWATQPSGVPF